MSTLIGSVWLFPALEVLHLMGIVLWVGANAVLDLRLMGVTKMTPVHPYYLLPSAHIGISITLATGVFFVILNPNYLHNPAFLAKMVLIATAVVTTGFLYGRMVQDVEELRDRAKPPPSAQMLGAVSLFIWFCVIIAGRYIPYAFE
jgi:hypothetical protein